MAGCVPKRSIKKKFFFETKQQTQLSKISNFILILLLGILTFSLGCILAPVLWGKSRAPVICHQVSIEMS